MIVKKFLSSVLVFVLAFASVLPSLCFAQGTEASDTNKVAEEKIEKNEAAESKSEEKAEKNEIEELKSSVATFGSNIKDGGFFASHKKALIVSSIITGSVALVSTVAIIFRNSIKEIAKNTYNKAASFIKQKTNKSKTQNISR